MGNYDITKVSNEITNLITPNNELSLQQEEIVNNLVGATTKDELKRQIELFNLNQSKKNAIRIVKLEQTMAQVEDKIVERFNKRPEQLSNRELIDFLNTISGQIDRSQKIVDSVETKDLERQMVTNITPKETGNQYNINLGTDLNRENKDNVVDAIKDILSLLQNTNVETPDEETLVPTEEVEVIKEN